MADLPTIALEKIVNHIGLKNVVELLAIIADEKSEHISSVWQDRSTAAAWQRSAKALDKASTKIEV